MSYSKAFLLTFLFWFGLFLLYPKLGIVRNLATQKIMLQNTYEGPVNQPYSKSKITLLNVINESNTLSIVNELEEITGSAQLIDNAFNHSDFTFKVHSIASYTGKLSMRSVENMKKLSELYPDINMLCGSSECLETMQGTLSVNVTR